MIEILDTKDPRAVRTKWDALQFVGDPKNSAPMFGPNIPRANSNGMFEERT